MRLEGKAIRNPTLLASKIKNIECSLKVGAVWSSKPLDTGNIKKWIFRCCASEQKYRQ